MDRETVKDMENRYIMDTYGRFDVVPREGKGVFLRDINGKNYLDFLAGIAVNVLGHCHPNVVEAVKEQAEKLFHCSNFYFIVSQSELAKVLCKNTSFNQVFFCNSGTEAVEAALKLSRKICPGHKVVALQDSFHGRTMGSLSATWKKKYRDPFEPLVPGFCFSDKDKGSLEDMVDKETAAVIMEPIQGEGGVLDKSIDLAETARRLCDENNALLVFDEVQTGMARTGKFFAHKWIGVEPDIVALAKGLGNGFPIGATLAKKGLSFGRSEHASTFGGNPLACSAAVATLETIFEENLGEKALDKGRYLKKELEGLDTVKEVRGKGLMVAAELDRKSGPMVDKALKKGILLNAVTENALRVVPPLIVEKSHIDRLVDVLEEI